MFAESKAAAPPPAALLPALNDLVLHMQHENIRTVRGLCVALTGDLAAGILLHRLLEMMPRSIRPDGAVWQPDHYWQSHEGITYIQARRARARLVPFVEHWVARAQGAPTHHYRINFDGLIEALARFFGRSALAIRALISSFDRNQKAGQKSITYDSDSDSDSKSNHQNQKNVVDFLIDAGVNRKVAETLAAVPLDEVTRIIDAANAKEIAGELRNGVGGYIVTSCRNWIAEANRPKPFKTEIDEHGNVTLAGTPIETTDAATWRGWPPGDLLPDDLPEEEPEEEAEDLELGSEGKYITTAREVWNAAFNQLEIQLDRATFDTWLRGAVYRGAVLNGEVLCYTIQVRNPFAADMLKNRLYRTIKRIVGDIAGREVAFEFVLKQKADGNGQPAFLV